MARGWAKGRRVRPPGEVRTALREAFVRVSQEHGPAGWRDVLPLLRPLGIDARSCADVRLVRKTVERMVSSGELRAVGSAKDAGQRVWRSLYEPAPVAEPEAECQAGVIDLAQIVRMWSVR